MFSIWVSGFYIGYSQAEIDAIIEHERIRFSSGKFPLRILCLLLVTAFTHLVTGRLQLVTQFFTSVFHVSPLTSQEQIAFYKYRINFYIQMKNLQSKKLFAFIISVMIYSASSYAQIVYTDINPDVVRSCTFTGGCGTAYTVDLNNDGINDFTLAPRFRTFTCGNCRNLAAVFADRDSAIIRSTAQSWIADTVRGYALNTLIDSSLEWTNNLHVLSSITSNCQICPSGRGNYLVRPPASGPWTNVSGKYLGLKIQVGSDFYYGWIKLGVAIASYTVSITVMEYAYNSTPNQPILAGQKPITGIIGNEFASSINLFPNPANNHLTIDLGNNNQKVDVAISDINGKIIYSTTAAQQLEVNTTDFAAGMYVVKFQTGDYIGTKRLIIAK